MARTRSGEKMRSKGEMAQKMESEEDRESKEEEVEEEEESKKSDEESTDNEEEAEEEEGGKKSDDEEEEQPTLSANRPVRVKKPIDHFTVEDWTSSSFIPKGPGMMLKNIPNVALKLSKAKPDDNLQALHQILFKKKAQTNMLKKNLQKFSGYPWTNNEKAEKEKLLEDKLEKCVKDQLFEFCDVLDIKVSKSSKKAEVIAKLTKFLECPNATQGVSVSDKKQGKKQNVKASASADKTSGVASAGGLSTRGKFQSPKRKNLKASASADKTSGVASAGGLSKSLKRKRENVDTSASADKKCGEASAGRSSKKQKASSGSKKKLSLTPKAVETVEDEDEEELKEDEKIAEYLERIKGKGKAIASPKKEPTAEELHAEITKIMEEADLHDCSMNDVLGHLETSYEMDLKHRKPEVKGMICEIATRMKEEEDAEEEEEDAEEKEQDAEEKEEDAEEKEEDAEEKEEDAEEEGAKSDS